MSSGGWRDYGVKRQRTRHFGVSPEHGVLMRICVHCAMGGIEADRQYSRTVTSADTDCWVDWEPPS